MARRRKSQPRRKNPLDGIIYNERIKSPKLRLVGEHLDEISKLAGYKVEPGIYNTKQIIDWAYAIDKDVIVISPNADPPVAKVMDLNKFLYMQKKKQQAMKANAVKTVTKEIRFGPNTDDHDFEFKVNHARKFLEEGSKVKAFVHFKGRTIIFKDRGELLLLRFAKELEDLGTIESMPEMKGHRRMTLLVTPKKKNKKQ